MSKNEFVKLCVSLGYSKQKFAEEYCEGKENLNENDFIEVYRRVERTRDICNLHLHDKRFRIVEGIKTTKRYQQNETGIK